MPDSNPETLQALRVGIRPESGAIFRPRKAIRAQENLSALDSILLWISSVPVVR